MPAGDALLLPPGARLLHIGPPKTATTGIQAAFHARRAAIREQGVRYAGSARHSASAVLAGIGRPSHRGDGARPPGIAWRALRWEIGREQDARVLLSSEFFADAEPDAIRRVVDQLGGDSVHVAVTLRPLAAILASQWQQYVQSGMRASYGRWLDAIFNQPRGTLTPTFWHRHRHDQLVERWAEVVGADHVTVIALNDDRSAVLRAFERLLGLRSGTLALQEDVANRSLTLPEVEAIRAFNVAFKANGLGTALHAKVMRLGAAAWMKQRQPHPDEQRIETPQWALDRAGEVATEMMRRIAASGVRVIGDLEALTVVPRSGLAGDEPREIDIPPDVAAATAMGVLMASGLVLEDERGTRTVPRVHVEPVELARVTSGQLGMAIIGRAWSAGARGLKRLGGRRRPRPPATD